RMSSSEKRSSRNRRTGSMAYRLVRAPRWARTAAVSPAPQMANTGRQAPSVASMMLSPEVVAPSTASNDVAAGLSHPRHGDHLRIAKALMKPVSTTATNSTLPPGSFQPGQDVTLPVIAGAGRVHRAQCRGPMRLQGLDHPDHPAAGGHRQRVIGESAGHR